MRTCPQDGERLLRRHGNEWSCPHGHVYLLDENTDPIEAIRVRRSWQLPVLTVLTSGAVATLVTELLK